MFGVLKTERRQNNMICDLSSVLNNDGAELEFSGQVDIGTETEDLGITFPDGAKVLEKLCAVVTCWSFPPMWTGNFLQIVPGA